MKKRFIGSDRIENIERNDLDTCPYCGGKLFIKNTITDILYLICPDCNYSIKDNSGKKIEEQTSCSNDCSACSGCHD